MMVHAEKNHAVRKHNNEHWFVRDEEDGMQLLRDVTNLGYEIVNGTARPYDMWYAGKK